MNAHCEMWERLGHCEHSPKYMSHYCRKSCDLCNKNSDKKSIKSIESFNGIKDRNLKQKLVIFGK